MLPMPILERIIIALAILTTLTIKKASTIAAIDGSVAVEVDT